MMVNLDRVNKYLRQRWAGSSLIKAMFTMVLISRHSATSIDP